MRWHAALAPSVCHSPPIAFPEADPDHAWISQTLQARFDYTRVQRAAGPARLLAEPEATLAWFPYRLGSGRTRLTLPLQEGILLEDHGPASLDWMVQAADRTGASLLKLTRIAPGPAPRGQVTRTTLPGWTIVRRAMRTKETLPLPATDAALLAGLGRHTRRNIRAARKLAAAKHLAFETSTALPLLTPELRDRLARKTRPRTHPTLAARFEAHAQAQLDAGGRPFRTVLWTDDGRVVSYCCGYFDESGTAYLLYQLNDPEMNALSPSLLHRAFLLEWCIQRGCDAVIFVHGCSGILHHACLRQPLEEIWLMRRSPAAYATAALLALLKPQTSIGRLSHLALTGG